MNRRNFLKMLGIGAAVSAVPVTLAKQASQPDILNPAHDMGVQPEYYKEFAYQHELAHMYLMHPMYGRPGIGKTAICKPPRSWAKIKW